MPDKLNIMKRFDKNFWGDIAILFLLIAIFAVPVEAGLGKEALTGIGIVGWIGWLFYKYLFDA